MAVNRADKDAAPSSPAGKTIASWIAQLDFPKAIFGSYNKQPSLVQQSTDNLKPQPIINDAYYNYSFPSNLTDPLYINQTVPNKVNFPLHYPIPENTDPTKAFYQSIDTAVLVINGSAGIGGNCSRCVSVITAAQTVARLAPGNFSDALIRLCQAVKFKPDADCEQDYATDKPEPAMWAQVLQGADVLGNDGKFICNSMFGQSWCEKPKPQQGTLNFDTDKPPNATAPRSNGQRVKVLHISDIHLDPRYTVGAEAVDCPSAGCCRTDPKNQTSIKNPAPFSGHPNCDTPLSLLASALSSVAPLSGKDTTGKGDIDWAIFTGDLMPRESAKYRNDKYLAYVQSAVYQVMKYFIPQNPVFPVLGALDAFNGDMQQSQVNNYGHMKRIIDAYNWLSIEESASIGPHRMGYTAKHPKYPQLRIIALNTNFWALQNYYTYVNTTNPRDSIILSDLIGWLIQAEKAQERVWIVGHVPPFAEQTLPDHSEAFYQVIERFSPHVIAGIFFGHLHTDSVNIFYKAGGKDVAKEDNVAVVSWLGPSLSPKSGHPSYKVYEVDTGDFRVYESRTYYTNSSNLSNAPRSQANTATNNNGQNGSANGLVWELGCDAREAYGKAINWPSNSPLNAAFWHRVGTTMLQATSSDGTNLAAIYRMFRSTSIDGKGVTGPCDAACVNTTVCRMRSAKESLWEQCGSDETRKEWKGNSTSVSTQTSASSNGNLSITSVAPTKRNVESSGDHENDIYIDYDNAANEEQQPSEPNLHKRWRSKFWSKVAAAAAQNSQDQGQSPRTATSDHVNYTKAITGTSTTTMTVSMQGGSSSIAKRTAKPGLDGPHSFPAGLDARSAEPEPTANPDDKKYTENILPAEQTSLTNWGSGPLSEAYSARGGLTSTGVQLLNMVISAQSAKTSYTIIRPNEATARARLGRDLLQESQDPMEAAAPAIVDDNGSPSGNYGAHDQEGQTLIDNVQIPDQPHQRREMTLANSPDATTTAASNSHTGGASEATNPPWDFPIYRPDEVPNGQILQRRSLVGGDGGAMATTTQRIPPSVGQAYEPENPSADIDVSEVSGCMENGDGVDCESIDKRSAMPDPKETNFLDLAIQRDRIKSAKSTWKPWTTNTQVEEATWIAPWESGYDGGFKKRTAAPDPSALPEPDPGKKLLDLWSSKLSSLSARSAAEAVAAGPAHAKRSAEPEPEPEPEPGNKLFDLWASRMSTHSAKLAAEATDPPHAKRSAEPEPEPGNQPINFSEFRKTAAPPKTTITGVGECNFLHRKG
ncbi:uncharacterized protein A1O9_01273 [Exophiala aquamarina CBS 119918]|uniref:Calcineurin-like phosphoesterase domain-containing protein n=1 Tax=Exophiala aquamarina CBS 119918 TaxID=1182545 RepID=A0A072PTY3_9EURO|nr:uncharacterized protein A1O9_01273 [Exophiala aquamarina CBS 119918]KEF63296.1 hypothetical protein A1O9_01273 [Exophiala aquamarina CBS 119918]